MTLTGPFDLCVIFTSEAVMDEAISSPKSYDNWWNKMQKIANKSSQESLRRL